MSRTRRERRLQEWRNRRRKALLAELRPAKVRNRGQLRRLRALEDTE
jgi:hypothetical protein